MIPGLDQISLAEYAARFGISHDALHRALFTSTQAILFLAADQFSAYAAFAPVVEGLKHFMTFRIGAFNGGMWDIMMKPIAVAIERRGGAVRLNSPVVSLACESDEVRGVHLANEPMLADHTVLAVSVNVAQELLRPDNRWSEPLRIRRCLRNSSSGRAQCCPVGKV